MTIDTNTLLIGLIACVAIAIFLGLHTKWRLDRLMRGKSGKDLEEIVMRTAADIDRFKQFRKELQNYLETIENRLTKSIRAVDTVRFNPFHGTGDGGNQSFATALMDEKGDGVVFSTLHARERMSIFAKPLAKFTSTYELTGEEKEAIKKAREKLKV